MKCTKCGGSGSEGFISFLRCGRCSGTGEEPADALVPYSDELIVVPNGPVMTAPEEAKADAMKAKKVMEGSAEKVKKAVSETLGPTGLRAARDLYQRKKFVHSGSA